MKFKLKNPLRYFFKPKEVPDDPLSRIPKEWKTKPQPQENAEVKPQEAKRGRGRPPKKTEEEPKIPFTEAEKQPKIKRPNPVRLESSYQERFSFRTVPGLKTVKRWITMMLLIIMGISTFSLLASKPLYAIIIIVNMFILVDYYWVTGARTSRTVKFSDSQTFIEWLRKQNVVFEGESKEEK